MKLTQIICSLLLVSLGLYSCTTPTDNQKSRDKKVELTSSIDTETYIKLGVKEESIPQLKALAVGATAPDFEGKDQTGKTVKLSELTKEGDLVLIFYRGYWCPYCTKYLAKYVEQLETIKSKGVQVIAVAPEGEQYTEQTANTLNLDIPFISDRDNSIMKKYGVAFKVTDKYNSKIENFKGNTLEVINEQDEAYLPIPATYIIGKNGKIKWVHYDPNFRERASIEEVLAQL